MSAELDDLLGDTPSLQPPSSSSGATAVMSAKTDELDDLIGGGGGSSSISAPAAVATVALDDDFLFSDPPKQQPQPRRDAKSLESAPPSAAPRPAAVEDKKVAPVVITSLPPLTAAPSPKLSAFIRSKDTYFVRFVQTFVNPERKRERQVLALTSSNLILYRADQTSDRTIPIRNLIGVMRQPALVSKAFGLSKDYELQMVIQVEGDRDVFVALSFDADNGSAGSQLDVLPALTALCLAHGVTLPVSELRSEESIDGAVKWTASDDRVRRQLTEALAYRTELQNELQNLTRAGNQLITSIESLKGSSATQAAADIHKDMEQIRGSMREAEAKLERINTSKHETEKIVASLQLDLQREESRRATAVHETMEAGAQAALLRQLTEYELMKAAHKREMDKIAVLMSFDDQRIDHRKGFSNATVTASQIALRIDALEEEEAMIEEKRAEVLQRREACTVALTEAKRRLALAKSALAVVTEEVCLLQKLGPKDALPPNITDEPATLYDQVPLSLVDRSVRQPAKGNTAPKVPPATTTTAAAPKMAQQPPPKPSPVVLDDDDDI